MTTTTKKITSLRFLVLFVLSLHAPLRVVAEPPSERTTARALTPPRGWNSYDSFCWTVSEEEFLQNAQLVSQKLHAHGYEYVVVDYLWYRRKVPGAYVDSLGFDVIDQWGRLMPDPGRWPSSKDGKGFSEVAKKVHSMGLKFGIHVMRGISKQAFDANTPVLDTTKRSAYEENGKIWAARDIGMEEKACAWMTHGFMAVNTKHGAGRAFLRSLYEQYAEWGVDFVKNDCVFGDDLDIDEITYVSEVLNKLNQPILYSLSPGTSVTPAMAKKVSGLVTMYRITGDDWDKWEDVEAHFDVTRDFAAANMIGATGLSGNSWPDLDMLPLGWLTDQGSNQGPHRQCNLTLNEQRTQMTLWAMARSPLMFGGDLRNLDATTYSLITNPTVLEINSFSSNNMEFPYVAGLSSTKSSNLIRTELGNPRSLGMSRTHFFALASCNDPKSQGWSAEAMLDDSDLHKVCWKEKSMSYLAPFCLYKTGPQLTIAEEIRLNESNGHPLASTSREICLDASLRQKLTAGEFRRGSLSQCRGDANQMWELNDNGALMNNYSGQCGIIKEIKDNAHSRRIRSWVATGRRGQVYVAFFNLSKQKSVIVVKLSDLAKALPDRNIGSSCKCREVWSRVDNGIIKGGSISWKVAQHGTALFVLNCDHVGK